MWAFADKFLTEDWIQDIPEINVPGSYEACAHRPGNTPTLECRRFWQVIHNSTIATSKRYSTLQITMEHLRKAKFVLFVIAVIISVLLGAKWPAKAAHTPRAAQAVSAGASPSFLDFETYRNRIEPIFLKTREGGVRCYDCHSVLATRLRLQPLVPGNSSWTEEQSRRNFESAVRVVTPSDPWKSSLLLHPLAQAAGGGATHTGGKFWTSQDDPEWKTIAEWVRNSTGEMSAAPAAS